jgi:lambda family phage portal protein
MSDLDQLLGVRRSRGQKQPTARYDAAQTTDDNRLHWVAADGLSANAANSPEIRRLLRNRSQYEFDNNPNVQGLVRTAANQMIGTGPRLQLTITGRDVDFEVPVPEDLSRQIEDRWTAWANAVALADKLRTIVASEYVRGEVFPLMFTNPGLADRVPLDLRLYEADQIGTPAMAQEQLVDGIEFDRYGNPAWYHVLKQHPGDLGLLWYSAGDYQRVAARQMIHLFECLRPGQARGVPVFTASLPAYAILRRYVLACLLSAEAQARINGVIEQSAQMADTEDEADGTGEQIQFAGTHMLTLSAGQTAKALPHSTPPPGYREFKAEGLVDGGRPMCAPRNISTGSSAEYNYSSGRLDQQQWHDAIKVHRERIERIIISRVFREWAAMALLAPDYLPPGTPPVSQWRWKWQWDGFASIDPVKDANAASERLTNGTSSLDRECGELGQDWEDVQDQRLAEELRELNRRKELGLPPRQSPQQKQQPSRQEDPEDA